MLLARELPQVSVPEAFLPLDLNISRVNIEKAAYHGFAKAQVKMGASYELCQLGCDFNPALSLHYNALAARQGEPEAEMAISKWFLCGHEGVFEKNDELAFTYVVFPLLNLPWVTSTKSEFSFLWTSKKLEAGTPKPLLAATKMHLAGSIASLAPRPFRGGTTRRLLSPASNQPGMRTSVAILWTQPQKTSRCPILRE